MASKLPHPKAGENKNRWMSRCMSDPSMTKEYPNDRKRNLQCQSLWNGENNMSVFTEAMEASQGDLDLINKWTLEPLAAKDVFVFSAKLIDDAPTANNRIWSKEWQQANAPKFFGVPVTLNHDLSDANLVVGRVFHSEQTGNAIKGKIYIPLTSETGREAAAKVKNGQLKSMSINAKSPKTKRENDIDIILPSDEDKVIECSFVASPGCETCGVTTEQADTKTKCECGGNCQSESDPLLEYARTQYNDLKAEFIRSAAFTLGTGISKATYQKLADAIDPMTLREVCNDFKRAYEANKTGNAQESAPVNSIEETFKQIRKTKGV